MRWAGCVFVVALVFALAAALLHQHTFLLASYLCVSFALFLLSPTFLLAGARHAGIDLIIVPAFLLLNANYFTILTPLESGLGLLCAGLLLFIACVVQAQYHIRHGVVFRGHRFWLFIALVLFSIIFTLALRLMTSLLLVIFALLLAILLLNKQTRRAMRKFCLDVAQLFSKSRTALLGATGFVILYVIIATAPGLEGALPLLWNAILANDILAFTSRLLGVCGLLLFMILPAYLWIMLVRTRARHHERLDWRGWQIGLVTAAMISSCLFSLSVSAIADGTTVGLRITQVSPLLPPLTMLIVAIATFFCCVLISIYEYARRALMIAPILLSLVFFGICIYNSFISSFLFSLHEAAVQLSEHAYVGLPVILLLCVVTTVFLITGFLSFLYEVWRD
jgi:hypothetical protein